MKERNIREIENKWQKYWAENHAFDAKEEKDKEKYYILVEFPYPSGAGLHIGHPRSYSALDAVARMKRMMGYNVLFPFGWDAFGAPAEQYAIKNHIHPKEAVKENIKTFKRQIQDLGISFDWSREFSTTDPDYYKWTQWQFLKFFEHNMAYKAKKDINWCPKCKTGLSNEDSSGGVCERCGTVVEQKEKEQWLLRMSDYSDQLLEGLDDTKFSERVKTGQINWIGKSTGIEITYQLNGIDDTITCYTTLPDTNFGTTFIVISPEHPLIEKHKDKIKNYKEVKKYVDTVKIKTEFERKEMNKDKTGVRLEGIEILHPLLNNKKVPVFTSDYVLMNYGTGAVVGVPAHDERDYAFAKKFNVPIKQVITYVSKSKDTKTREDKKTVEREAIIAVVEHPSENKYLVIKYNNFNWKTFLIGGIEKNDTIEETLKKELREETGYTDVIIKKINDIGFINEFYAAHKDENRVAFNHIVYAKLNSLNQVEISADERNIQTFEWVEKDRIQDYLTFDSDRKVFDSVMNEEQQDVWKVMEHIPENGEYRYINSEFLNGITSQTDAIEKIMDYMEEKGFGKRKINYRLQDWIFSRQRFWGEPIPLVHCKDCGWVAVPYDELPVTLPDVVNYEPTEDGESPLATITEWVNTTCPKCGAPAKRETDTMPNWAGSSWYWLRYMDAHNKEEFASIDAMNYWGKVDWYNGGMEHTTRHLLYARFWNQFLYNIGLVPNKEPFTVRVSHGMILGDDGEKISKSKNNGMSPDVIVEEYGADVLRTYMMFIGDYEKDAVWNNNGLVGIKRFLERISRLKDKINDKKDYTKELESIINKTIKKVTDDMESMKYNTAVSALMILANAYEEQETISKDDYRLFITLLNPIAPHITEELNEECNLGEPLYKGPWPKADESKLIEEEKEIAVQVNGKVRATITVSINDDEEIIREKALNNDNVKKHTDNSEIVKIIVIKGKIVNIVVK